MSNEADDKQSGVIHRRHFLGAMGTGAVAATTSSAFLRTAEARGRGNDGPGRGNNNNNNNNDNNASEFFSRMFPQLSTFRPNSAALQAAMRDIGRLGGIMDAQDAIGDGSEAPAIALVANAALSVNNPNNPVQTAGHTFFGQFLDHDMTFDQTSQLAVPVDPRRFPNTRNPTFDLDSVYGGGPIGQPELYQAISRTRRGIPTVLRIEFGGLFEDLPRNLDGSAILGDPRNDENMMLAGLQQAMILFHNNAVALVTEEGLGVNNGRGRRGRNRNFDNSEEIYGAARQLLTWHYQWIILNEILPIFCGQEVVTDVLENGRRFYRPRVPMMPVEFQGAAFRFGHTMVRPSYRANLAGDDDGGPFFGMIFDPHGEGQDDPIDLRGGARAPRRFIGWQTFFDFGPDFTDAPGNPNPAIRPNKLIDTTLSTTLLQLPVQTIAGGVGPGDPISLPSRNLLRHITWGIPSGQAIARVMGAPALTGGNDEMLRQLRSYRLGLEDNTPLWFYILREGLIMGNGGAHLGPVGGRIVAEVMIGLLQLDPNSFLNAAPNNWAPTLAQRSGQVTGDFTILDLLTFAGVAPDQRGQ